MPIDLLPANEVIPQIHASPASDRAKLPAEDHLHDDIAALAAEFFRDADAVKTRVGELVPQRERDNCARPRSSSRAQLLGASLSTHLCTIS